MANQRHLEILKQGVDQWNEWRRQNASVALDLSQARNDAVAHVRLMGRADLSGAKLFMAELADADLSGAKLMGADLSRAFLLKADLRGADLCGANLQGATLIDADLSGADLHRAILVRTNLFRADLSKANLTNADLSEAELSDTNLSGANLGRADLSKAILIRTNFNRADLTSASIFGISAWDLSLEDAVQKDLVVQGSDGSVITLDDLEVAQFIYLLLNNQRVRKVIDTITSKVVLILGRFTPERKATLDALREELRRRSYLPILFDFERPAHRDLTETVSTLAHIARFVIADITDAKSIPQELLRIVPNLPSVPVQPLLLASQREYGMFEHFRRFPWVLEPVLYEDQDRLMVALAEKVIVPAETKAREQTKTRSAG